jgi:hypothetical protein
MICMSRMLRLFKFTYLSLLIVVMGINCKKSPNLENNETKAENFPDFEFDEQFDTRQLSNLDNYCGKISINYYFEDLAECKPEVIPSELAPLPEVTNTDSFALLGQILTIKNIFQQGPALVRFYENLRNAPKTFRFWVQIMWRGRSIEIPLTQKPTIQTAKTILKGFQDTQNKLKETLNASSSSRNWGWLNERERYYLFLKDPSGKPLRILVRGDEKGFNAPCKGKGCEKIAEALALHFSKPSSTLPDGITSLRKK